MWVVHDTEAEKAAEASGEKLEEVSLREGVTCWEKTVEAGSVQEGRPPSGCGLGSRAGSSAFSRLR